MKIVPNKIILILAVLFLSASPLFAAPGPPPPSTPPPPPGTPLDGGIAFLALISLTYGLYKIVQLNKKKLPIE
ncbi:hypothetical protein EZL74_01055 [Flavobacterium silvisoli]|uniref:Signal peptidase n=1 Tax=Flavobacterium silvisoli TaxID=2529433 RepID=A0A4Q9Z4M4_9FLAO|nr:hypothetical protein EZL74_01055 [Flavobacterium silvisoli]